MDSSVKDVESISIKIDIKFKNSTVPTSVDLNNFPEDFAGKLLHLLSTAEHSTTVTSNVQQNLTESGGDADTKSSADVHESILPSTETMITIPVEKESMDETENTVELTDIATPFTTSPSKECLKQSVKITVECIKKKIANPDEAKIVKSIIKKRQEYLQYYYLVPKKEARIGFGYLAKYPRDGSLRRAVIYEIYDKHVSAVFIDEPSNDFFEYVPIDSLRYLQDDLANLPALYDYPELTSFIPATQVSSSSTNY